MTKYQWYHTIELLRGVVTPGQYDHRPLLKHYGIPPHLTGKTVVDVGPAHGFFAIEPDTIFGSQKPRTYFHGTVHGQAFWAPNMRCLEQWALAAGFQKVERVSTFPLKSLDGQFDVPHDEVTIYTTNVYNCELFWRRDQPEMPVGVEVINGVTVRRFPVFNRFNELRRCWPGAATNWDCATTISSALFTMDR